MDFYEDPKSVSEYIKMCKDYNGEVIYKELREYIKPHMLGLEIGSGPGNDLPFLIKNSKIIGSDNSEEFIKKLKAKFPKLELHKIDAKAINLDKKVDYIFSNKVLHHLTESELIESTNSQFQILNSNGLVIHTFWLGEGSEEIMGMNFKYYSKDELERLFSRMFKIVKTFTYKEMEESDSILIIGIKN